MFASDLDTRKPERIVQKTNQARANLNRAAHVFTMDLQRNVSCFDQLFTHDLSPANARLRITFAKWRAVSAPPIVRAPGDHYCKKDQSALHQLAQHYV